MTLNTPDKGKNYSEITKDQAERWVQNQLKGYEKEKFEKMKNKFSNITRFMDLIASDLEEADKLWILIRKDECENRFDFDRFYNSHMKQIKEQDPIDFTTLYSQLSNYHAELQKIITEAKRWKTEELKAAL